MAGRGRPRLVHEGSPILDVDDGDDAFNDTALTNCHELSVS